MNAADYATRPHLMSTRSAKLYEEKTFKETAKDILDNFSNSVLTTFMQGLLDPFTGENGIVTNMMKDLGKSIFGSANKDSPTKLLGDGASKWVSDAFSGAKSFFGFGGGETTAATGVVGADDRRARTTRR